MEYDALRDLVMAGVTWELADDGAGNSAVAPASDAAPMRTGATVAPVAPQQPVSPDVAVAMAARPTDIDSMLRMIAEFNHPLRATATNVVLPHIAPRPNGMIIITDIPGPDDDACGQILAGAAGELMDKMLAAIGMSRDDVSITPMLFWRTPGGRTPTRVELDLARPFLNRMIQMLAPRVILTLGTLPATEIAGINLARAVGVATDTEYGAKMVPIYHPNFLILKPSAKRDAWTALQTAEKLLKTGAK